MNDRRKGFVPMTDQLFAARQEFLAMIADAGGVNIEYDGDETGDHSTLTLVTGWRQMRDFIDALGIAPAPNAMFSSQSESDITKTRIERAVETHEDEPPAAANDDEGTASTADLILKVLGLIYDIGVNDGLREAVPGRRSEIEGKNAAVAKALELLQQAGIEFGPTKCSNCHDPATLCETCALDRAEEVRDQSELDRRMRVAASDGAGLSEVEREL